MSPDLLDLYSDYLIFQTKYATATGLADLLDGAVSHDAITRFLNGSALGSKDLWLYVKERVRRCECEDGVLILDDTIEEKPYTDENEIVCWHYCHTKSRHIKGINLLSCLVRYGDVTFPVGYEVVHKDITYCEIATRKIKRTASVTKNEHFRKLIGQCHKNQVKFKYVLADNWFGSAENLSYIHKGIEKKFIIGVKSNRTVALSHEDRKSAKYQQVASLEMEDGQSKTVWLKDIDFPVVLVKKIFTNEDGSTGVLYLVSNDITTNADALYQTYQKRWGIEVYHKSVKQNASLAKSPTKKVRSQANHIFASIIAFCKLEALKIKTATNHFAIKYKLILAANIAAMNKLACLAKTSMAA